MACRGLGFVGQSRSRIALLCEEGALTGQRRAGWALGLLGPAWACLGLPGPAWLRVDVPIPRAWRLCRLSEHNYSMFPLTTEL